MFKACSGEGSFRISRSHLMLYNLYLALCWHDELCCTSTKPEEMIDIDDSAR